MPGRRPKTRQQRVGAGAFDISPSILADSHTSTELLDLDWHTISVDEVFRRLSTETSHGLSLEQAKRRLSEYGKNAPSPAPTHYTKTIFGYFFKGFGSILLLGSILVFVCWKPLGQPPTQANLALAIVLLAVFFIQAAFNAWQDWSSSKVMASITTMLPENSQLLRDGAHVTTLASDIVPGDILFIKAGNKLSADVRFVEVSSDAKFDRSILTGLFTFCCSTTNALLIITQANHSHFLEPSTRPTTITSRHAALVCKVPIAFLEVLSVLSWPLAIRPFSDVLPS